MVRQIKEYQEEMGYTLKGMEMSLRYFHEVLENEADAKGIGIIPYVYEDAKRHYMYMANVRASAESELEESINIRPAKVKARHKKKTKEKFNIEEL